MLNKANRFYAVAAAFAFGAAVISSASTAAVINSSVGGVPAGAEVHENFDGLAAAGGLTANGITVTFGGTGAGTASLPDASGQYAAPFISGSNGASFGNPRLMARTRPSI